MMSIFGADGIQFEVIRTAVSLSNVLEFEIELLFFIKDSPSSMSSLSNAASLSSSVADIDIATEEYPMVLFDEEGMGMKRSLM
eukprot:scaffold1090_cov244-Chaetoceros_neogracile.AAC.9